MSDKQLAVLLAHVMRQINLSATEVERELLARGMKLQDIDVSPAMWSLRGVADLLEKQVRSLETT